MIIELLNDVLYLACNNYLYTSASSGISFPVSHCCGAIGTPSPSLPFDSCEILEDTKIQGHVPLEIIFSVPMLHNRTPLRDFIAVKHPTPGHFLPVNVT